jgi:tetratricopeptide (TPR) repeat protein
MIELLLQAERALSVGLVDQAERLYRQAADADPRNSIAVVGLARVALERADDRTAYAEARRALAIDPENAAAVRLVTRLEEVFAHRGEALPPMTPAPDAMRAAAAIATPAAAAVAAPDSPDVPGAPPEQSAPVPPVQPTPAVAGRRPGLLDRLLRRNRA